MVIFGEKQVCIGSCINELNVQLSTIFCARLVVGKFSFYFVACPPLFLIQFRINCSCILSSFCLIWDIILLSRRYTIKWAKIFLFDFLPKLTHSKHKRYHNSIGSRVVERTTHEQKETKNWRRSWRRNHCLCQAFFLFFSLEFKFYHFFFSCFKVGPVSVTEKELDLRLFEGTFDDFSSMGLLHSGGLFKSPFLLNCQK